MKGIREGAHRNRVDPDSAANFLDGIPWRAMGLLTLGFIAVPGLLLVFAAFPVVMVLGWSWWLR